MILPYRAKNPPDHFPYVTLALIVINLVVYGLTTDSLLAIRPEVVDDWALSHNTFGVVRLITAMFLHENPLHLGGNMLFLWIFGPPVEGRLRPLKYLFVYLATGMFGGLLEDVVVGLMNPEMHGFGASGAIMGIAGAYLWMFPFATTCVFWWFWYRIGVSDWQAQWVILLFVATDLIEGFLFGAADGVGHFVHLGGFAAGFLFAIIFRTSRDSEARSAAQVSRTDLHQDYSMLSYPELEALMEEPAGNVKLIMAFFQKAMSRVELCDTTLCGRLLREHSRLLMAQADRGDLGRASLWLSGVAPPMPTSYYLLLGSQLEGDGLFDLATQLYRRAFDLEPESADGEMALYRMARVLDERCTDKNVAAAVYRELLRRFPSSEMAFQARQALKRLADPSTVTTIFQEPGRRSGP